MEGIKESTDKDWEWTENVPDLTNILIEFTPTISMTQFKEQVIPKLSELGYDYMSNGEQLIRGYFKGRDNNVGIVLLYKGGEKNVVNGGLSYVAGYLNGGLEAHWKKYGWLGDKICGRELFNVKRKIR